MMRTLFVVTALLVATSVHAQSPAQPGTTVPAPFATAEAVRAAQEGLGTFAKLVTDANVRALGFTSRAEVEGATLGTPFGDLFIPLDRLKAYQLGAPLKELIRSGPRVVFPVLVAGTVRSAITVARVGSAWKAVGFGAPDFVRRFSAARDQAVAATGIAPERFFIVRVPALNAHFLAFEDPGQGGALAVVQVLRDVRFDLPVGQPVPAATAVERMLPIARRTREDGPG